jgi:hypothetical protein
VRLYGGLTGTSRVPGAPGAQVLAALGQIFACAVILTYGCAVVNGIIRRPEFQPVAVGDIRRMPKEGDLTQ